MDSLALGIFFAGKDWKYFLEQRISSGQDGGEKVELGLGPKLCQ